MKKSISFGFLLIIIMVNISCSDNKISEDKVPGIVVSAFKTKYPESTGTKWTAEKKDGKTVYEVEFKNNGKEEDVEFNEDGSLN